MTSPVTASSVGLGPRPLAAQETPWRQVKSDAAENVRALGATHLATFQREVADGHLSAFVTREPTGPAGVSEWHLSISHRTNEHSPKAGRYPTWDELAHARYELLPADLTFAMFLPPQSQYVAVHDTTFHLYETHPGQVSAVTKGRRRRGRR